MAISDEDMNIYEVLDKRAKFVRRTNIALIILLIMAATLVASLIVGYKDNQKNWIANFLNDSSVKRGTLRAGDLVLFRESQGEDSRHVGVFLGNDADEKGKHFRTAEPSEEAAAKLINRLSEQYKAWKGVTELNQKSQSEKVADSIATVLLTLSLIIFVGFVMRAVLVFIRYYMQLGTDFENQRLAYIISKSENLDFGVVLKDLRDSSINFEKTPNLPQEKIILGLVEALKGAANINADKK